MEIIQSLKHYNLLLSEIEAEYHKANTKLGISDSYSIILYVLCIHGTDCSLNEIRHLSGLNKQTLNSALRNMEKENLITLIPIDGKSKKVCLTPEGKSLMNKTVTKLIDTEKEILSSWTVEERETYLQLMKNYLTTLKEKVERM